MTIEQTDPSHFDGTPALSVGEIAAGERTAAVYEVLREWIVSGQLEPGQDISQLELTRRVGTSRTPLREALRQLTRDGLVEETAAHRRVKIGPLSMVDLDQVYTLRVPAEALAIWHTVPQLTVTDLVTLRSDLELINSTSTLEARDAHRRFHAGLTKYAGRRVEDALWMFMLHSERYQRAFVNETKAGRNRKASEHRAILRACEGADRTLARRLLVEHMTSTAYGLMEKHGYRAVTLPMAQQMALAGGPA